MSIKVSQEVSGELRVTREEWLGNIKYIPERKYPWEARKGNTIEYFATQEEALNHIILHAV